MRFAMKERFHRRLRVCVRKHAGCVRSQVNPLCATSLAGALPAYLCVASNVLGRERDASKAFLSLCARRICISPQLTERLRLQPALHSPLKTVHVNPGCAGSPAAASFGVLPGRLQCPARALPCRPPRAESIGLLEIAANNVHRICDWSTNANAGE